MRRLLALLALVAGLASTSGCGGCGRAGVALPEAPNLGAVVVERESWSLYVGQRVQLRAWGGFVEELPRALRADEVTWRSEDPSVAEVQGLELVARAPGGPVTLVAETESGEARVIVRVSDASPVSLDLTPRTSLLAVGDEVSLSAALTFGDGTVIDVTRADIGTTWTSSDATSLSISEDGVVTALATSPEVVVIARNGLWSGSAKIRVTSAPVKIDSLEVNPGRSIVSVGNRIDFSVVARLDDGTGWDVSRDPRTRWSSSDAEAIAIDATGRASVLRASDFVTISASFYGHRAAARVRVSEAALVSMRLVPSSLSLPRGSSAKWALEGTFADGHAEDLSMHPDAQWTVAGEQVHLERNRVDAISAGGPVLVSSSFSGQTASGEVTVGASRIASWAVDASAREVRPGEVFELPLPARLEDGTVVDLALESTGTTYAVEPAGILSRTSGGRWAASRANGVVRVRAKNGGVETAIDVTVKSAPSQVISLAWEDAAPLVMEVGATQTPVLQARLGDGRVMVPTDVVWFSEAPEVVAVNEAGALRAIAVGGPVRVTASVAGVTRSRLVSVVEPAKTPTKLEIELDSRTGVPGERLRARAFATNADSSRVDVTKAAAIAWRVTSGDASARVESPGRILLVSAGEATIEAELRGVRASATLVVGPLKLTGLVLSPESLELPPGFVDRITVLGTYDDGSRRDLEGMASGLLFSSSNEGVVTVSNDGTLRARAEGTATIEATVGELRRTVSVRVALSSVTGLSINPPVAQLPVGRTIALGCLAALPSSRLADASAPASGTRCISSAPDVATMEGNLVRAHAIGSARITCLQRGAAAVLALEVVAPVVEGRVTSISTSHLALGTVAPVVVADRTSDGLWADRFAATRFESTSPTALWVTSDGVIDARGLGTASVSVTAGENSSSLPVTVRAPLAVSLACDSAAVRLGETVSVVSRAMWSDGRSEVPGPADGLVWRSSDPSLASIDATGVARGLRVGVAELYVHLDGRVAACPLEVLP